MPDNSRQLLADAVARNCPVVLSLPSAGLLRHQKSRFLSESSDSFWLQVAPGELPLVQKLIQTKLPAGISFKAGQAKVIFTAPILELDREHRLNSETVITAIRIAIPEQIKSIQRRSNYRVCIIDGSELSARVWRIAPRVYIGERPPSTAELQIVFRDLSIGGMGVIFLGAHGQPVKISTEDRLRIEIRFRDEAFILEGRMRQPSGPQQPDRIFTGIQFKDMGNDIEGRQKLSQLTRIIGEMQREEARRARLGLG